MKHIVLETPRLYLRRMTLDDVPVLLRVFADADVMRFYPALFDEARMQRWVAWNQQLDAEHSHGLWAVILRATDECIGDCGLVPQPVDGVAEIEIGCRLHRDLWGQDLVAFHVQSQRKAHTSSGRAAWPSSIAIDSERHRGAMDHAFADAVPWGVVRVGNCRWSGSRVWRGLPFAV